MIMWGRGLSLLSSGARSLDNASSGLFFGWHRYHPIRLAAAGGASLSMAPRPVLAPPLDQYRTGLLFLFITILQHPYIYYTALYIFRRHAHVYMKPFGNCSYITISPLALEISIGSQQAGRDFAGSPTVRASDVISLSIKSK